jgi:hypothetical protein
MLRFRLILGDNRSTGYLWEQLLHLVLWPDSSASNLPFSCVVAMVAILFPKCRRTFACIVLGNDCRYI